MGWLEVSPPWYGEWFLPSKPRESCLCWWIGTNTNSPSRRQQQLGSMLQLRWLSKILVLMCVCLFVVITIFLNVARDASFGSVRCSLFLLSIWVVKTYFDVKQTSNAYISLWPLFTVLVETYISNFLPLEFWDHLYPWCSSSLLVCLPGKGSTAHLQVGRGIGGCIGGGGHLTRPCLPLLTRGPKVLHCLGAGEGKNHYTKVMGCEDLHMDSHLIHFMGLFLNLRFCVNVIFLLSFYCHC